MIEESITKTKQRKNVQNHPKPNWQQKRKKKKMKIDGQN